MKIAILTSPNQWFSSYAKALQDKIPDSKLFVDHKEIKSSFDVLFILSYHLIIDDKYLKQNKQNIIIHASDLPKGKGWSPMFWQILDGSNEIVFSMFEADSKIDNGYIYMKKTLSLNGYELNQELREKQAKFIIDMCLDFVNDTNDYQNKKAQSGNETFYKKRTSKDSELDINKSIKEQFNLLRIVDNENYPAFFYKDGKKYIIKITKENDENR